METVIVTLPVALLFAVTTIVALTPVPVMFTTSTLNEGSVGSTVNCASSVDSAKSGLPRYLAVTV